MTTADTSIFVYTHGLTHSNFSYPDFIPKFLDEADQDKVENATKLCGVDNLECIFDFVFTGSEKVADDTKRADQQHTSDVQNAGRYFRNKANAINHMNHIFIAIKDKFLKCIIIYNFIRTVLWM